METSNKKLLSLQVKVRVSQWLTQSRSWELQFIRVKQKPPASPFLYFVLCFNVLFTGIKFSCLRQENKKRGNTTTSWHTCFYITVWFPGSYQYLSLQHSIVTPGVIQSSQDICSWMECPPIGKNAVGVHCFLFGFSFNSLIFQWHHSQVWDMTALPQLPDSEAKVIFYPTAVLSSKSYIS